MSKLRIAGWILSGLLAAFLILGSARAKLTSWEGKAEAFEQGGWTEALMYKIGIVEVAITVLFLLPQTAFLGAVLLTGYLGGAVATHVRVGEPFHVPIIVGVVVWIVLGLRDPRIFPLAFQGAVDESGDVS